MGDDDCSGGIRFRPREDCFDSDFTDISDSEEGLTGEVKQATAKLRSKRRSKKKAACPVDPNKNSKTELEIFFDSFKDKLTEEVKQFHDPYTNFGNALLSVDGCSQRAKNLIKVIFGFHAREEEVGNADKYRVHAFFRSWPSTLLLFYSKDEIRLQPHPPHVKDADGDIEILKKFVVEVLDDMANNMPLSLSQPPQEGIQFDDMQTAKAVESPEGLTETYLTATCPYACTWQGKTDKPNSNLLIGMTGHYRDAMLPDRTGMIITATVGALKVARARMLMHFHRFVVNYQKDGTRVNRLAKQSQFKASYGTNFTTWLAAECLREAAYLLCGVSHVSDCQLYNAVYSCQRDGTTFKGLPFEPVAKEDSKGHVGLVKFVENESTLRAKSTADLILLPHKHSSADLDDFMCKVTGNATPFKDAAINANTAFQDMLFKLKELPIMRSKPEDASQYKTFLQYPLFHYREDYKREVFLTGIGGNLLDFSSSLSFGPFETPIFQNYINKVQIPVEEPQRRRRTLFKVNLSIEVVDIRYEELGQRTFNDLFPVPMKEDYAQN